MRDRLQNRGRSVTDFPHDTSSQGLTPNDTGGKKSAKVQSRDLSKKVARLKCGGKRQDEIEHVELQRTFDMSLGFEKLKMSIHLLPTSEETYVAHGGAKKCQM